MATTGVGVTIGNHSVRGVKLRRKGDGFVVQRVFHDRLNEETRPVAGRALAARGFRGSPANVGLTGRDVIIRYSQVPPVPEWRLRNLMKYEVDEVGSQSGGDVSADYRKLNLPDPDGERSDDVILVALTRNAYLERQIRSLDAGGIKMAAASPNSVALFNAFAVNATYSETETSLLVNIGSENLDIAVQRGGELLFARNATPGGKAFTEAIQQAFSTSAGKAEQMKLAKADVTPKAQATYPDPTSEKVANAIVGVAGQLSSLIQSTLMIARAQVKMPDLKVDRVHLAGGGASLRGLDLYLKQAMGVPVDRLDPFAISDLSGLTDAEREMAEKAPHEFAVAVGLAQMKLDVLAFPLEVLPAALKRRRDFVTKGIFSVAAAVVALGILFVIYQGRKDAVADARKARASLKRVKSQVDRSDGKFRSVLASFQESAVKHRLLAEVAAPGALLAKTWHILEINLADTKDVYLDRVELKVDQFTNEFPYYQPKRETSASGYVKASRSRYFRREAIVTVKGRIAGEQRPDAVYQEFVQKCQANTEGLIVETEKVFRRGPRGTDGSFTLVFRPGIRIQTVAEEGADPITITLTHVMLDRLDDPSELVGRRADGLLVRIPKALIPKRAWRNLEADLKAAGAAETMPDDESAVEDR